MKILLTTYFWKNNKTALFVGYFIVAFYFGVFAYTPYEFELPTDENEAEMLLSEGVLDSALWIVLKPYYRRPLHVPSGELSLLGELFPTIADDLPVTSDVLERYLPWDQQLIRKFFADYPELVRFKPILQFNCHKERQRANVSFYMNRIGYDTTAEHAARFTITPFKQIRATGSIDFTADYARWDRRSIDIKPNNWVAIRMGNTLLLQDYGLIYGRFPSTDATMNSISSNWLYGSVATWNGVSIKATLPKKKRNVTPEFTGFYHVRPTEKIAGTFLGFDALKKISGSCGVSFLSQDSVASRSFYIHNSLQLRFPFWNSEFHCSIENNGAVTIPFLWENRFHFNKREVEMSFTHIPASLSAPLSRMKYRFENEVSGSQDSSNGSLSLARVTSHKKNNRPFSFIPQVDFWFNGYNISHCILVFKGEGEWDRIYTRLLFSQKWQADTLFFNRSRFDGVLQCKISSVLSLKTLHRCTFNRTGILRYRGSILPSISIFSRNVLEPSVSLMTSNATITSLLFGCRQELKLFSGTTTEFLIEQDVLEQNNRSRLRVEGKAVFLF